MVFLQQNLGINTHVPNALNENQAPNNQAVPEPANTTKPTAPYYDELQSPLSCEHCGCQLENMTDMKLHKQTCHAKDIVEFECKFCPFKTKLTKELRVHNTTHNINFTCDECNFISTSEFSYNLHHDEKQRKPVRSQISNANIPMPTVWLDFC